MTHHRNCPAHPNQLIRLPCECRYLRIKDIVSSLISYCQELSIVLPAIMNKRKPPTCQHDNQADTYGNDEDDWR